MLAEDASGPWAYAHGEGYDSRLQTGWGPVMAEDENGKKGLGARLAGLFRGGGGGKAQGKATASESYKGFDITAEPKRQGSSWVTAGVIRMTIEGVVKEHRFVRADTHSAEEDAVSFSIRKAKQIIDEQEKTLFNE